MYKSKIDYALKVKSSKLFNGLNMGAKEKEDLRMTLKIFGLINSVYCGAMRWGS